MGFLKKTLRLWWQKPRKASEREKDRTVSFLELFYDLTYVIIIAELTHALVSHLTIGGVLTFIGLFAIVWWAWVNGSYYHENHSNYDIRTRVFTFLQMLAVSGMAVFAHNATGAGQQGFALSYAFLLLIIAYLWWRTGVHDSSQKRMSYPYALGFLVTSILFGISAFTPAPFFYYMWGGGVIFSLLLPFVITSSGRNIDQKSFEDTQRIRPSLVERFGLFTIIVLGEVIVSVVGGVSQFQNINMSFMVALFLGLCVAIGMWWIYFDFISHHMPIQKKWRRFSWMYLHLPLTMSIALVAAGLLSALEHGNEPSVAVTWLLVAPVCVFLISIILLNFTIRLGGHEEIHKAGAIKAGIAAVLILMLGFLSLNTLWLLVLLVLFLMMPVFAAFRLWVRKMYNEQQTKKA